MSDTVLSESGQDKKYGTPTLRGSESVREDERTHIRVIIMKCRTWAGDLWEYVTQCECVFVAGEQVTRNGGRQPLKVANALEQQERALVTCFLSPSFPLENSPCAPFLWSCSLQLLPPPPDTPWSECLVQDGHVPSHRPIRVTCGLSYIKLEAACSHLSHHVESKTINNANRDSQELGGKKRAGSSHAWSQPDTPSNSSVRS